MLILLYCSFCLKWFCLSLHPMTLKNTSFEILWGFLFLFLLVIRLLEGFSYIYKHGFFVTWIHSSSFLSLTTRIYRMLLKNKSGNLSLFWDKKIDPGFDHGFNAKCRFFRDVPYGTEDSPFIDVLYVSH